MDSTIILPNLVTDAEQLEERDYHLKLARTKYNYMQTYLPGVPMTASVPSEDNYSLAYKAKVLRVGKVIAENYKNVLVRLVEEDLKNGLDFGSFKELKEAWEDYENTSMVNLPKKLKKLEILIKELKKVPDVVESTVEGLIQLPKDIAQIVTGVENVIKQVEEEGLTAILKSGLYELLGDADSKVILKGTSAEDYEKLFDTIAKPLMMDIPHKEWMATDTKPCEQDWFFSYLQTAGFNTTNLIRVCTESEKESLTHAITLSELVGAPLSEDANSKRHFPITDEILQSVVGDKSVTLEEAVNNKLLYVCNYEVLDGAKTSTFNGIQRYLAAPIALFYCSQKLPKGYPPANGGFLVPVAIQLNQMNDCGTDGKGSSPIFTPNDCSGAKDPELHKWKVAKFVVNTVCAIQHESVAHLGACHLTVEPMILAAHRQLSKQHPLFHLLEPHFRFTLQINDDARNSLIVPRGVVATNVGPAIESTLDLVAKAHQAWRWDEQNPDQIFKLRGVDALPSFPFRDDTRLLWASINKFVSGYVGYYYENDAAVKADTELQAWINELVNPEFAGFKGLNGLKETGNAEQPFLIDSVEYLAKMIAQIIYIAGPQHVSVNFAQYPLMSYMPSVAGTIYRDMPTRDEVLTAEDCFDWYPPLDVSLYTFSFEYLLSNIQFDRFAYYSDDPRVPYFDSPELEELLADFQGELSMHEVSIRQLNKMRPMPYPFQLPSQIPNSISI